MEFSSLQVVSLKTKDMLVLTFRKQFEEISVFPIVAQVLAKCQPVDAEDDGQHDVEHTVYSHEDPRQLDLGDAVGCDRTRVLAVTL